MKTIAILLLMLISGKALAISVPPVSVGMDSELLTETPIPIPHRHTATFTPTQTFTATFTASPTATVNSISKDTFLPPSSDAIDSFNKTQPTPVQVETPIPTITGYKEQGFFEGGLGISLPAQNWQPIYGSGTGAEAGLGVMLKDGLVFQLNLEFFGYSGANTNGASTENEFLLLPTVRHFLAAGDIRPYVLVRIGLAVETTTTGTNSATAKDFDLALGAGFEFQLENSFSTFVEAQYNFVFLSSNPTDDIPVVLGARFGL